MGIGRVAIDDLESQALDRTGHVHVSRPAGRDQGLQRLQLGTREWTRGLSLGKQAQHVAVGEGTVPGVIGSCQDLQAGIAHVLAEPIITGHVDGDDAAGASDCSSGGRERNHVRGVERDGGSGNAIGEYGRCRHVHGLTVAAGQGHVAGVTGDRVAECVLGHNGDVEAHAGDHRPWCRDGERGCSAAVDNDIAARALERAAADRERQGIGRVESDDRRGHALDERHCRSPFFGRRWRSWPPCQRHRWPCCRRSPRR